MTRMMSLFILTIGLVLVFPTFALSDGNYQMINLDDDQNYHDFAIIPSISTNDRNELGTGYFTQNCGYIFT